MTISKYVLSQKTDKYVLINSDDIDYNTKFALVRGDLVKERSRIYEALGDYDYKMLDFLETMVSNEWIDTDYDLEQALDYVGFDAEYFLRYLDNQCMEYFDKEHYQSIKDNLVST
mgnify:CR=1 FL=1